MLTPDYLKGLPDSIVRLFYDVEDYIIADIARRIRKMGTATSTAEIQRIVMQAMGEGTRAINKRIADALRTSEKEVERIFAESVKIATDNQGQIAKAVGVKLDTGFARRIGDAAVEAAKGNLGNLTRTAGYLTNNGQFTLWTDAYKRALNLAQMQVATGAIDYNTAIRQAIKPFTDQGMRSIAYASGKTVSIEAAARQCIIGGVSDMATEIMKKNAADLGTDGWEISAHADCAPDHEPYQGRQYSNEEYEALNNSLARPIGALGCRHTGYPIMMGISERMYSDKQLSDMRRRNANGIEYEGKHYSLYEADQTQRRIERSIRKTKREMIGFDNLGQKDDFANASIKLRRQRDYYADFSDKAGLVTRNELLQVSGYGRSISGKAVYQADVADFIKNDAVQKAASGLPKKVTLPDEVIKETIHVDLEKLKGVVPRGSTATSVYSMAGNGTCVPIRDLPRLHKTYPQAGHPKFWEKKSADVYGENYKYVVHWYENRGFAPEAEFKLKGAKKI